MCCMCGVHLVLLGFESLRLLACLASDGSMLNFRAVWVAVISLRP
jgi:hypothetical protein